MAPRFNVENMPPTRVPLAPVSRSTRKLKSSHSNPFISSIKVKHNGIHAARRRSRPVRPTCPKQTPVSHTQCIDVEMRDGSQSAGAGPSTHHVKLPRTLIRPDFNAISRDAIEAVACHLADVPVEYIREGLECEGPDMLRVLSSTHPALPTAGALPRRIKARMTCSTPNKPTHMLAVYPSSSGPACASSRKITLLPAHDIILAAHCANLPVFPPTSLSSAPSSPHSGVDGAVETLDLPVLPLCIPSPETFPILSTFLYTRRRDHLLSSLVPAGLLPAKLRPAGSEAAAGQKVTAVSVLAHLHRVNAVWRNACALGTSDDKLWEVLITAWEVLLLALGKATGTQIPPL